MPSRKYIVHHKRGRIEVIVPDSVISLRGERKAVVDAAWRKLMGQNDLGEDVDKKSPTRKILMTEMLSIYEPFRARIYDQFSSTVTITWVGVVDDRTV